MRAHDPHRPVARAPLLRRLVDTSPDEPREARPPGALDRDALVASIAEELAWVLCARCPRLLADVEAIPADARTVLDIGLPSLAALSPRSPADRGRLQALLARTVAAYEPRLRNVRVALDPAGDDLTGLRLTVTAQLVAGRHGEAFSFPLAIPLDSEGRDGRLP